jgi:rod shape-determining protein MreD
VALTYTSREAIEVHRFPLAASVGVPLAAVLMQAFLPARFHWFEIFDLPLLVTIFFAMARRNPVTGLITGALIGILQDSLTHNPLGVFGIAKTVVGYAASSLGVRIDVQNPGVRLGMTFAFYQLHQAAYFLVVRGMMGQPLEWRWGHELVAGAANGLLAVVLFAALDRLRRRA